MGFGGVADVGRLLFTDYLFPFELASILLLVAMIGAIVTWAREEGCRRANLIPFSSVLVVSGLLFVLGLVGVLIAPQRAPDPHERRADAQRRERWSSWARRARWGRWTASSSPFSS